MSSTALAPAAEAAAVPSAGGRPDAARLPPSVMLIEMVAAIWSAPLALRCGQA